MAYCSSCGAKLKDDAAFCHQCGAKVDAKVKAKATVREDVPTTTTPKSTSDDLLDKAENRIKEAFTDPLKNTNEAAKYALFQVLGHLLVVFLLVLGRDMLGLIVNLAMALTIFIYVRPALQRGERGTPVLLSLAFGLVGAIFGLIGLINFYIPIAGAYLTSAAAAYMIYRESKKFV